jgi:hypothetical protein
MRRTRLLVGSITAVIAAALLILGCASPVGEVRTETALAVRNTGEQGSLNIAFAGTGPAAFTRYTLALTNGDTEQTLEMDSPAALISLPAGSWDITVTGYVTVSGIEDIPDGEYPAALGSASVTILPGSTQNLNINLGGVGSQNTGDPGDAVTITIPPVPAAAGTGTLRYDIILPDGATALVSVTPIAGGPAVKSFRLGEGDSNTGSFSLDGGYRRACGLPERRAPEHGKQSLPHRPERAEHRKRLCPERGRAV